MSIAFKCPNCQQPYKVKDDMAGKRVVCTACKKPIRVPAPMAAPAVPSSEADAMAVAALAEAPAAPAEEAAATITVECPNCIEQVTFPADKAGKQAPCPSCKRIIKVPIPSAGKQDWRTADARPTFAKAAPEADLKDVVTTANMKIVDREALLEAGAIRKREREPLPMRVKITRAVIGICLLILIVAGGLLFRGQKVHERRDDLVAAAIKQVKENTGLPTGVRAETYRAAGEYVLGQPDGEAAVAKDHLGNARGLLAAKDAKATDQPFEKQTLLTRILLTQTALVGDQSQIRSKTRLDWAGTLQELRYTFNAFDREPSQWEGSILAVRGLTQSLGLRGATPEQPAIVGLVTNRFTSPPEHADALAAVGLELFAAGEAGQNKAKELAEQVREVSDAAGSPRVIALLAACRLGDPPLTGSPLVGVRVGAAEGFARRGDLEAARKIAEASGSPEDRFEALVAIAAAQPGDAEPLAAVEFFAKEFKTRDLPDWPLIHLSQICADSKAPDPAKKLNAALADLGNLSPRSQAVRAWAQMELLRSPHLPATEAAVKAIVPETSLGHQIAWEVLTRRTATANSTSPPLALVGAALGSMK
jgi:hypothetical protein